MKTSGDDGCAGWSAGVLSAGVAADERDEFDGLHECHLGTERERLVAAEQDRCIELVAGELVERGPFWFSAGHGLEAFGS